MATFNQPLGGNEMPRFAGSVTMMCLPAHEMPAEECWYRSLTPVMDRD